MSNLVFPPASPGPFRLAWGNIRTPEFKTDVARAKNGRESRKSAWVYPLWHFKVSYNALGQAGHQFGDQLRAIQGFFLQHRGAGEDFLFQDPEDFQITDQVIGTADGATKNFQIVRNYGGFIEPIFEVKAGTLVVKNQAGTTLSSGTYTEQRGLVMFTAAPNGSNGQIRATCQFYFRVRFENDLQDFDNFTYLLHRMKEVRLVSVKP